MSILIATPNPAPKGDGSELSPYNLSTAIDKAKPGDTIMLRGIFREVVKLSKTYAADAPLTIAAHPDKAVFDGGFALPKAPASGAPYTGPDGIAHHGALVQITGKHIAWTQVDIKNSLGRGIGVSDTSDVELRDFTVDWSRNAGVHLHTVERVVCRNVRNYHAGCYFQKQRPSSKEFNWPVAFNVLFSQNVIIDGCESSYNWGEGFALGRGTSDSVITGCVGANSMGIQIYLHRSERCKAVGNLVYCDGSLFTANGVVVNNEDNFDGTPVVNNMLVANNIAVGCKHSYAIWNNEGQAIKSTGVRFLLNTSINATESALLIRSVGVSAPEFIGNLFYQKAGAAVEIIGPTDDLIFSRNAWLSPVAVPAAAKSPSDITGVKLANPDAKISYGQVDVANYATLAAHGVGAVPGAPATDYAGRERKAWTVGALEFVDDTPPPPPDVETVTLTISTDLPAADAAQLRALLAGRSYTVELVD